MDDKKIIELFFARDEKAISETEKKYGKLARYVASNILSSREDAEECVNDALLALWNSIPPDSPEPFLPYIAARVKNIAVSKSRANNAWKRGGNVQIVNDEILSTISDGHTLSEYYESRTAGKVINDFVGKLNKSERKVFILRYWYRASDKSIMEETGFSQSKIKSMLARLRARLAEALKKEGIII